MPRACFWRCWARPHWTQQQSLLANIQSATSASAEMLHSLLDYSRVEAGVITPQRQAFALQALLNKMERELAPLANTKGLFYRSRDTAEVVLSDPSLIELILRNLISNAIRYTQRGGILVGCRRRGDQLLLEYGTAASASTRSSNRKSLTNSISWAIRNATARKAWALGWPSCAGWPSCCSTPCSCSRARPWQRVPPWPAAHCRSQHHATSGQPPHC
jgi:hypothetical protein